MELGTGVQEGRRNLQSIRENTQVGDVQGSLSLHQSNCYATAVGELFPLMFLQLSEY